MPPPMIAFDTEDFSVEQRFDRWASGMSDYAVGTPDPLGFSARLQAWLLGPVIFVDATLGPVRCARDQNRCRADGRTDIIALFLDGPGLAGTTDDRPVSAESGDLIFHDLARPITFDITAGRNLAATFPRSFLEERLTGLDLHGLVLHGAAASLPGAAMLGLPGTCANSNFEPGEVARILRDIMVAAVRHRTLGPGLSPGADSLRARARRYILNNLAAPLDIAALCDTLGASRSQLYRAFEEDGGVARYVQARRLAHLHRLLADPTEQRSIGTLAAAFGFVDNTHFARLFRRAYGYSAQDLRRRSAVSEAPVPERDSAPDTFNRWQASAR